MKEAGDMSKFQYAWLLNTAKFPQNMLIKTGKELTILYGRELEKNRSIKISLLNHLVTPPSIL